MPSRPSLRSLLWVGGDEDPVHHDGVPAGHGHRWDRVQHRWDGSCDGRARARGPRALVLARPGSPRRGRPRRPGAPPSPRAHPRAAAGPAGRQRRQAGRGGLVGVAGGEEARPRARRRQHPGLDGGGAGVLADARAPGRLLPPHAAAPDHRAQPAVPGLARADRRQARAHRGPSIDDRHVHVAAVGRRPHRARLAGPGRGAGDPRAARRRALHLGRPRARARARSSS